MRAIGTKIFLFTCLLTFVCGLASTSYASTVSYTYSFTVSNPNFQLPAGTITFVQPTSSSPLQVTISLNSGFSFGTRNATIAFNAPAGSSLTISTPWKVAKGVHLNMGPLGQYTNGFSLRGNKNPPISSVTFTISNPNGISSASFIADNIKGTNVYFAARVYGPVTNGILASPGARVGWLGATRIIAVPEPSSILMLGAGFLVAAGFSRRLLAAPPETQY